MLVALLARSVKGERKRCESWPQVYCASIIDQLDEVRGGFVVPIVSGVLYADSNHIKAKASKHKKRGDGGQDAGSVHDEGVRKPLSGLFSEAKENHDACSASPLCVSNSS